MKELMDASKAAKRFLAGERDNPEVMLSLNAGSDKHGRDFYLLCITLQDAGALKNLPSILKRVIKEKSWEHWRWIDRDFSAPSLKAYLETHPPKGLGTKVEIVEKLIDDDHEVLALFRAQTVGEKHKHTDTDNITITPERGTSRSYLDDRLRKNYPQIFAQLLAGQFPSTRSAAIAAGIIKVKSPLQELRTAWKRANARERAIFKTEINDY